MSPNRYWQDRRTAESDKVYSCKRMRLEDVPFDDFSRLEGHWKTPGNHPDHGISYARIVNPIFSENPEELLTNLLRNPYVDELCVCERSEVVLCKYARTINENNIGAFLSALKGVTSDIDILRVRLRKSPRRMREKGDRAVIYFSRVDEALIAYKAIIPPEQREIMKIDTEIPNSIHLGICEPPAELADKLGREGYNLVH